ncbi:hypothetical protein, partial [Fulvivirga lutimaris]|uniref:hypothetical protein n=1 Tax=Fulvivirga lutimaris TaxID=1819566 RepID=UPI001C880BFA
MKRIITTLSISLLIIGQMLAQNLELSSPDKRIQIKVNCADGISWSATLDGKVIIEKVTVGM